MKKLAKGDVAVNGLLSSIVKVVEEAWKPELMATETAYRDSLLKVMREVVPEDCRVEREYRHAGTTADIYLAWKGMMFNDEIFIEMKRSLQKKAAFDRLIGQIEELQPSKHKILLILVGDTDKGLLGRLNERYNRYINGMFSSGRSMAIIVKSAPAESSNQSSVNPPA